MIAVRLISWLSVVPAKIRRSEKIEVGSPSILACAFAPEVAGGQWMTLLDGSFASQSGRLTVEINFELT